METRCSPGPSPVVEPPAAPLFSAPRERPGPVASAEASLEAPCRRQVKAMPLQGRGVVQSLHPSRPEPERHGVCRKRRRGHHTAHVNKRRSCRVIETQRGLVICIALGPVGLCVCVHPSHVWVAPRGDVKGRRMKRIRRGGFETGTAGNTHVWRLARVRVHLLARPTRRGGGGGVGKGEKAQAQCCPSLSGSYRRTYVGGEKRGYAWRSVVSQSRR
jgi:hypothetical protein